MSSESQGLRVAAVQFKASKAAPAESLRRLVPLAEAAAVGSDLVVLPEMAATGYVFSGPEAVRPCAEAADGPTLAALAPVARAAGCWVVVGFPEVAEDRLYNSALVIDPDGSLAFVYRKTLLFEADETWATPGDSGYRRFETGRGAFGVGICMDLNDDGFVDWIANAQIRAVAFPTNWLEQGIDVWSYWAWRLTQCPGGGVKGVALVAANSYGAEGAFEFCGRSAVLDGRVLRAAAPKRGDGIIRATLRPHEESE